MVPMPARSRASRLWLCSGTACLAMQGLLAPVALADGGLSSGGRVELSDYLGTRNDRISIEFAGDPGSLPVADPSCPAQDGQLLVSDDDQVFTATLPCSRWSRLRTGFLYEDLSMTTGIQRIVLDDHGLTIEGGGRIYGLNPVTNPATFLQVELHFADERYCGRFEAPAASFLDESPWRVVVEGPSRACHPSVEIVCARRAGPASPVCSVTPGGSAKLLVGDVLGPDLVYHGGEVLVSGSGKITCVGCSCGAQAPFATRVVCPHGVISPGLINTHDHLTFDHYSPHPDTGERYEHRHDWRKGLNGHTKIPLNLPDITTAQEQWAELRNVMSGTTSSAGGGGTFGLLRNLDLGPFFQHGLGQTPVNLDTFPLHDGTCGNQLASTCAYPSITTAATVATEDAYLAHVAEGIDAFAHNEFECLSQSSGGGQDLLQPQSAFVHGIALGAGDYAAMVSQGASLVWTPRSNIALYGDTAAVGLAARLGMRIALGTDWILTGSMNLLRELRCAEQWSTLDLGGLFDDEDLWKMVTVSAAKVTATSDVIGSLAGGRFGDIAVFDGAGRPDHRAVVAAEPQDVVLVLRGGKPLYGDAAVIAAIPGAGACGPVNVCGSAKRVCLEELGMGTTYLGLQAAAGNIYPAFACGVPPDEPTCVPSRGVSVAGSTIYDGLPVSGDADGDGIPDDADDCPAIFNPIRPIDGGAQPDADNDGLGDVCDPTPLP